MLLLVVVDVYDQTWKYVFAGGRRWRCTGGDWQRGKLGCPLPSTQTSRTFHWLRGKCHFVHGCVCMWKCFFASLKTFWVKKLTDKQVLVVLWMFYLYLVSSSCFSSLVVSSDFEKVHIDETRVCLSICVCVCLCVCLSVCLCFSRKRFELVKSPEVTLCGWLGYKPSINK